MGTPKGLSERGGPEETSGHMTDLGREVHVETLCTTRGVAVTDNGGSWSSVSHSKPCALEKYKCHGTVPR